MPAYAEQSWRRGLTAACAKHAALELDLLFWRYSGRGEQDPTGALGFETAFQGTQIGNGF